MRVREFALKPPGFRGEVLDLLDSMQRLNTNPLTSSSPSFRGVMCRVIYRTQPESGHKKNNTKYTSVATTLINMYIGLCLLGIN